MSTNPDFVEFVKNTFEKLSDKFTHKNKQYEGEGRIIACGELANFRIGFNTEKPITATCMNVQRIM